MLTARAEFRLALRADNAETRLAAIAEAAGCLTSERRAHQAGNADRRAAFRRALDRPVTSATIALAGGKVSQDGARKPLFDWLRDDSVVVGRLIPDIANHDPTIVAEVLEDARYAPYLERQAEEVRRLREAEGIGLPAGLDFATVPGLSIEMVSRLGAAQPASLAAAARIRGITPAALSAILLHAKRMAA
jgi:tRNA uridine 5-carboxymethylaminomethyl modification enzyme